METGTVKYNTAASDAPLAWICLRVSDPEI